MDENKNPEVGDCVQINDKTRFNGMTGRIERIYMREEQEIAIVGLDDGYKVSRKFKNLISRNTMACDELF